MPSDYLEEIIPGSEPTIRRTYTTGDVETLTGDRALAMANAPGAAKWRAENPEKFIANYYSPLDVRDSKAYRLGSWFSDLAYSKPTMLGRAMEQGPGVGGVAGAITGAGTGALAGLLKRLLTGDKDTSLTRWSALGGILGALVGAHNGYVRSTTPNTTLTDAMDRFADKWMNKSAAMYTDPRNFILEKLQAANDVSVVDKVKLAAGVHNLDRSSAEKLAAMVRAALGFGVGAIISKFLFGASGPGMLFGGMAGMFGTNFIVNTFAKKDPAPKFDFNFRPLSYKDIL